MAKLTDAEKIKIYRKHIKILGKENRLLLKTIETRGRTFHVLSLHHR